MANELPIRIKEQPGFRLIDAKDVQRLIDTLNGINAGTIPFGTLTMTNPKTDFQQFVSIQDVISISAGTWTKTRVAQSNYTYRHTAAANTSILGIDLTPVIRTAASKGFRLASIDVLSSITTQALTAHTATLDLVTYVNNAAVAVTSVPLTGTLPTATQANPYVSNLAVTTPAFDVTGDTKYVFELTVNAQASSAYDFNGLMLKFARNDL